jgi:hypothetical protein
MVAARYEAPIYPDKGQIEPENTGVSMVFLRRTQSAAHA